MTVWFVQVNFDQRIIQFILNFKLFSFSIFLHFIKCKAKTNNEFVLVQSEYENL